MNVEHYGRYFLWCASVSIKGFLAPIVSTHSEADCSKIVVFVEGSSWRFPPNAMPGHDFVTSWQFGTVKSLYKYCL